MCVIIIIIIIIIYIYTIKRLEWTILSVQKCLAYVYRIMDARGKLGEHERSVECHEAKLEV